MRSEFGVGAKGKGAKKRKGFAGERISPGLYLPGQMGADIDHIVGDHPKPDPALDAGRPPVERSPQPVAAFENTDATFTPSKMCIRDRCCARHGSECYAATPRPKERYSAFSRRTPR